MGDTVIEIIAGGDIDKNKVVEFGKYPIYANSHSGDGIVGYYDDFYRVNGPAVTVTGRGEVGFAKARETDFTPVVRLLAIRSKHNHYFLENAINLHGVTVESTGVPQLTVPQLSAYRIYFPYDIQEENQIGTFFSTLDQQITLHQRKLDKLKSVKQAYLSEMFPAEGERVPKRRFPGFTDAWELRKLKELADFSKGLGYTKNDLTESGNPIILYGRLYTKYQTVIDNVDTFVDVKDKSVVSIGGEVIVPSSGESSEDIARASVVDNAGVILGGDLNVIKPKDEIDSTFLALTISNGQQQKELSKRAQGKSVVHLHNSDLKEVNLIFPSIDEQKQIGELFKGIENTITLHQRKS